MKTNADKIPTTPITTLNSLAAEGKFASADLQIPSNVSSWEDVEIFLDGVKHEGSIFEIYAPGDDTGWAVIYTKEDDKKFYDLIHGNWSFKHDE